MIIKIRWNNSWVIYDGFDKVHYEHYAPENAKKVQAQSEWMQSEKDKQERLNKPVFSVVRIICRKVCSSGGERLGPQRTYKTDCPVYLLNDEGKTIEKIN